MKIRAMSIDEDLIQFSSLLQELEKAGILKIISSSKLYPNRRSIESRGYIEIQILRTDVENVFIDKLLEEEKQ